MATIFTLITAKDLQKLQGIPTYKQAWAALRAIKDALNINRVLVKDLSRYWVCTEQETAAIINQLG